VITPEKSEDLWDPATALRASTPGRAEKEEEEEEEEDTARVPERLELLTTSSLMEISSSDIRRTESMSATSHVRDPRSEWILLEGVRLMCRSLPWGRFRIFSSRRRLQEKKQKRAF
jgi:hypothetical protein